MDTEDEGIPGITKMESKLIKDIIGDLIEDSHYYTSGDQLFTIFTRYQVIPEKQLKIMLQLAFELSGLADACEKEDKALSDQYLRLSTLATDSVQEKFGQPQDSTSSTRRGRAAKTNATINMQSYYDDVLPTLFNTSDDDKSKKRRKKEDKVVWSDSELQETEPLPQPPKVVETLTSTDEEVPASSSKERSPQKRHLRRRKRVFDVVCIDSSSDEEPTPQKTAVPNKKPATTPKPGPSPDISKVGTSPGDNGGPSPGEKVGSSPGAKVGSSPGPKVGSSPGAKVGSSPGPKVGSSPKPASKQGKAPIKIGPRQTTSQQKRKSKSKLPAVTESGLTKVMSSAEKLSAKAAEKNANRAAAKSVLKPVGVVKATPRPTPPDSKRATSNCIKEDEALILNFKKGHYPTFQNKYTHLAVAKKPHGEMYTDTSPKLADVLALETKVAPSSDLKKYTLKQFIHNDSGQYMVGELDDELYLIVPGTINKENQKNKEKT